MEQQQGKIKLTYGPMVSTKCRRGSAGEVIANQIYGIYSEESKDLFETTRSR